MKNKMLLCLLTSMTLTSLCEARIPHQRNMDCFMGGQTTRFQDKKQQSISLDSIDFEKSNSPAACTQLPRYVESLKSSLLEKTGKTGAKILQDEKEFYTIVLNLVRKGGDYGFKASGYDSSTPEQEYLLSHKIDALKLITNAKSTQIAPPTRSEAAFLLASLLEDHKLASNREIFTWNHIAFIHAPETIFGAKAAYKQVKMIDNRQVIATDLPLATHSRLLNGIQQYNLTDAWKKASFPSFKMDALKKAKILHAYAKVALKQTTLERGFAQSRMVSVY